MKNLRYLWIILLTFNMSIYAQITTVNQLKIKSIKSNNSLNQILVRDSISGLISYLDKSTLGGGGATPNLDSVMGVDGMISNTYDRYQFMRSNSTPDKYSILYYQGLDVIDITTDGNNTGALKADQLSTASSIGGIKQAVLYPDELRIIRDRDIDIVKQDMILIPNSINFSETDKSNIPTRRSSFGLDSFSFVWDSDLKAIKFNKPNRQGEYYQVTGLGNKLADSNGVLPMPGVQEIVDQNQTAVKGSSTLTIFEGTGTNINSNSGMNNGLSGVNKNESYVQQTPDAVLLSQFNEDSVRQNKFRMDYDGISFEKRIGSNWIKLLFEDPIYGDGAEIKVPSLPTNRSYKLSVAEVFENPTTIALSADDLNTAYPRAQKGDIINCLDISGGPIQYMKTSTGWISRTITIVP